METELDYLIKKISELRKEAADLAYYLDLLEARALNFGKKRYSTEQLRKVLNLK